MSVESRKEKIYNVIHRWLRRDTPDERNRSKS